MFLHQSIVNRKKVPSILFCFRSLINGKSCNGQILVKFNTTMIQSLKLNSRPLSVSHRNTPAPQPQPTAACFSCNLQARIRRSIDADIILNCSTLSLIITPILLSQYISNYQISFAPIYFVTFLSKQHFGSRLIYVFAFSSKRNTYFFLIVSRSWLEQLLGFEVCVCED